MRFFRKKKRAKYKTERVARLPVDQLYTWWDGISGEVNKSFSQYRRSVNIDNIVDTKTGLHALLDIVETLETRQRSQQHRTKR